VPDVKATHFQRPVDGPTMQSFAQAVNYLVGWRFRRAPHTEIEWDVSGSNNDPEQLDPTGITRAAKVTWRTHPKASYVFVEFSYQAARGTAAAVTYADADLRLAFGGAVQDAGCRWDQDRGDLAADSYIVESGGTQGDAYRILLANTGAAIDDAPAAFPTVPRLLNVGTAQGVDVEVRLTTQNVRLHQVTVWEFFEPEIDQ